MNTAVMPANWPQSAARFARTCARAALAAVLVLGVACSSTAMGQTRPMPRPQMPPPAQVAAPSVQPPNISAPKPRPQTAVRPSDEMAISAVGAPQKGPVTGQPLPRFVSLKGGEGNARRGPGLTHRIDWVFTTAGTPLRVTAEYENWRRVEDFEGLGGWVHFALLSGARYVLVTQDMANFYRLPNANSPIAFQAERGVLARLLECSADWCRVNADGQRGWAEKSALWGVEGAELVE